MFAGSDREVELKKQLVEIHTRKQELVHRYEDCLKRARNYLTNFIRSEKEMHDLWEQESTSEKEILRELADITNQDFEIPSDWSIMAGNLLERKILYEISQCSNIPVELSGDESNKPVERVNTDKNTSTVESAKLSNGNGERMAMPINTNEVSMTLQSPGEIMTANNTDCGRQVVALRNASQSESLRRHNVEYHKCHFLCRFAKTFLF